MMQRIKLMADFDCYPLWDMDDGGDIDPTDLPLSEGTIERLLNWQNIYEEIIDWDDPASAGFASKEEEIAFEREGISLWQKVQKELGDDYQVFYKSQLQQRVLTSVYKSRFSNYLDGVLTYEWPRVMKKKIKLVIFLPQLTSCYTINNRILTHNYARKSNPRSRSIHLGSALTHRQKYRLQTRRSLRQ